MDTITKLRLTVTYTINKNPNPNQKKFASAFGGYASRFFCDREEYRDCLCNMK